MPLRVIDVESTISNSQAGGIHFTRSPIWHVISHTWSADVREFSSIIDKSMKQAHGAAAGTAEMGQHDFEKDKAGGFYRYPIYQKLVEFLTILLTRAHQAIRHVISHTWSQIWHVISHTWSHNVCAFLCRSSVRQQQHMAVETVQHVNKGQIYEALFEAAGFHNHPAYQKLIEFLIILQAEEVRWVWFDAVCINQTDTEEKDHEIQHMGTYYQKGVGCYVLQHGIGKGFELLLRSDDDNDDGVHDKNAAQIAARLPRWFTRAWTLQEWVLPAKATFIIDLTSEQWLCRIASIVLLRASGRCLCCLYESTLNPSLLRQCKLQYADIYVKGHEREEDDLSTSMVKSMKTCQCSKPRRDPHFRKVPGRRQWYFADDLGYSFLLRLKFHMHQIPDDWDATYFSQKPMADAEFELTSRLGVKQALKIGGSRHEPRVIREISMRDCSNPEDRVLSVLKLLGVQNAFQVRTGKSLDAQLLHLAKSLVDSSSSLQEQELLINLCLVDGFGNEAPGMSWMPQFEVQKGSWQEGARLLAPEFAMQMTTFDTFKPEMRCHEVTNMGMLRIDADVCSGHLICDVDETLKKAGNENRRADEVRRSMVLEVEGQVIISYIHAHMFKELEQRTTCILAKVRKTLPSGNFGAEVCIALNTPGLQYLRDRIPVWLVKVGCSVASYMYWLVCVREGQGSSLHKIGYLSMAINMSTTSLFSSSQKMHCFIGGLGHHASKLLCTTEQRD